MKNGKQFLTLVLGCFVAFVALGQEFDDMYFNSKDRAKLNEGKIRADLGLTKNNTKLNEANTPINPTDSYSARSINPEYTSQINNGSTPVIEDNYFMPDFQPTGVNQNLSNCNCGSGSYYNPYYGNSAFNNPYYGSAGGFGSPYSNFYPSSWGNSYGGYGSGLSMSLGYGWGGFSPSYYGQMGYGYNYGSYANNFWNPYNSWGGGYYNSYYPSQVVVINNSDAYGRKVSYSKRNARSSNLNHDVDNSRYNSGTNVGSNSRTNVTSGRSRTATPEYYDRSWKRSQSTPTRSYWGNSNSNSNTTRSSFGGANTNSSGRTSGYTPPSRNSFNSGTSTGGSRSSGSSTGSSSGGSKTRGRNN